MAQLEQQPREPVSVPAFEQTPWLAADRTVEDPQRAPEPPLKLDHDGHVVDLAESDSLRLAR